MTEKERAERCCECQGYGDDYYRGADGEMHCACDDCPCNDEEVDN